MNANRISRAVSQLTFIGAEFPFLTRQIFYDLERAQETVLFGSSERWESVPLVVEITFVPVKRRHLHNGRIYQRLYELLGRYSRDDKMSERDAR